MTQPETLKGEAIQEVEHLAKEYPYFAIGNALLTIAYQNTDDNRYTQQLRRTAAIMPNRDKLRLYKIPYTFMIKTFTKEGLGEYIST